jgi:hypothetical protein
MHPGLQETSCCCLSLIVVQGWFLARQSGEVTGAPEGVALFVNQSTFKVLQSHTVRFSDHADEVKAAAQTGGRGTDRG